MALRSKNSKRLIKIMNNEPFIKQGVVAGETEEKPVVTDSDQTVKAASMPDKPFRCCGGCNCRRNAALNNQQKPGAAE
jgi:hypothetical protein